MDHHVRRSKTSPYGWFASCLVPSICYYLILNTFMKSGFLFFGYIEIGMELYAINMICFLFYLFYLSLTLVQFFDYFLFCLFCLFFVVFTGHEEEGFVTGFFVL